MAISNKSERDEEHVEIFDVAGVPTIKVPLQDEDLSYGRTGVRGVIESPYVFGAALLASMGGFSFGYDQGVISIIIVMDAFHDVFPEARNGFGKGFMTGMLEFGAFLGCFFFPWLADKISRKKALSVVVAIFNVGAILQTAAVNYEMLVLGRTIGGNGIGTLALGAPLYISEISPPALRGTLLVLETCSIVLGVVISYWITFATRHLSGEISFRRPLGLQMVSATMVDLGIHIFPYSPRWLAMVGRNDDALASLAKLRRLPDNDHRVQAEHYGIVAEARFQKLVQERRHPKLAGIKLEIASWFDFFRKSTWRRTASDEMSLIMAGVFNTLQLVAMVQATNKPTIIDKVGRRPLAIWGGAGGAVFWGVMAVLVGLFSSNAIRSKGAALSTATNWISNFLVGVVTPPMIESLGFGMYVFYGYWCLVASIWAYFMVPETMGKSLEQMDEVFKDKSGHEERELQRVAAEQVLRELSPGQSRDKSP
ncbi:High-affinity glucose transporter 11 [Colletotrichum sojae]|uniref:High-affinity glucose transporter 11 n=1 Tax=Colletotrichum sojae TaxID=2175907 RepID=A0A8H6MKE7_9PEZI|nr:High-affinity glucose transporter 11 [Colletotrichum sojae]